MIENTPDNRPNIIIKRKVDFQYIEYTASITFSLLMRKSIKDESNSNIDIKNITCNELCEYLPRSIYRSLQDGSLKNLSYELVEEEDETTALSRLYDENVLLRKKIASLSKKKDT